MTGQTRLRADLRDRLAAARLGLRREIEFYCSVARHPETPRVSKVLLGAAIGYTLLPFDLVPDFLPVVGHLDDLVVVPVLLLAALRFVPPSVIAECRSARAPAAAPSRGRG